ncbi:MAG: bifunctional aspartate kinase/diaminopimelate decarboxylase [Candidatus Lernaella stagnicola]|nr:bifunctional aspartate kinase/diaminopimelate decarboxylase [Candidatus Lernaella stagnicola]
MLDHWVVAKFGGTSVSSRENWHTIMGVCHRHLEAGRRPMIVCSALAGVSDSLEELIDKAPRGEHKPILKRIGDVHRELAANLEVNADTLIGPLFDELERLSRGAHLVGEVTPRLHARMMAVGELMATRLGAAFLSANGVSTQWQDAREYLVAEGGPLLNARQRYLSASCCYDAGGEMRAKCEALSGRVIVTQGFIASTASGDTVLLGRGGSDTSAAYFAAMLDAERLEIWTDVPGMFTANPHIVPSARLLKSLDYDEAQEITSMGAKVLHPRCLQPVRDSNIPIEIRCTNEPGIVGTVISADAPEINAQVKAVSTNTNVTVILMETLGMWQQVGFLADVFACFKKYGLSIDLVSTSETNVTVSLDNLANAMDTAILEALTAELECFSTVRRIDSCASVSLVGRDIRTILHRITPALVFFEEIPVHMVSQAANDLNVTFVIDQEHAARLVEHIHRELFENIRNPVVLGRTWEDIFDKEDPEDPLSGGGRWWIERREELVALAEEESPLFVYDEETLRGAAARLLAMNSPDRVFYAVKANWHPGILQIFHELGLGFECVSPGEIEHVFSLFPDIAPRRILFTPNFAPRAEYELAFERGGWVTLDNLYPLEQWPDVFAHRDIFVRIDPGRGRGHHDFVKTGGKQSKFGISLDLVDRLVELASRNETRIVGLHAHTGSGILSTGNWKETAGILASLLDRLPDVKALDLGGGFGVVEKPGQSPLDLVVVDAGLAEAKAAFPNVEIWIEPGRYLTAPAGVLLARVTQVKTKDDFHYVGIDTGMNTLIRPALYGAYHEIVNLSKWGSKKRISANIVGPICESGDVLGHERRIAAVDEGDVILIGTAGAYGRAMSSEYNRRLPAAEVMLPPRRG